jgi:uncharacterized protein
MTDPFEALREPYVPVTPDPQFAARLRAQLERALLAPTGDTMSTTTTTVQLQHGDISYTSLWTPDADRAADFYGTVLDWRYAPAGERQGRQVAGLSQHIGMWGDQDHSTTFLCFVVDDIVAATERVRAAGGQAAEPSRQSYGFVSQCTDDQGLVFAVSQELADHRTSIASPPGPGEMVYLTIGVPDTARFHAFFGSVLGWQFTPGRADDGWNVLNDGEQVQPMTGLIGGHDRPTVTPMFQVRDVAAAAARVRAAGGTSTEPAQQLYGTTAECTDDQGAPFYLGQV